MAYVEHEYDAEFTIGGMRHLLTRLGFSYIKPKVVPGSSSMVRFSKGEIIARVTLSDPSSFPFLA